MSGFGAILLDPPFAFDSYSRKAIVPTQGEQPYKTMQMYEIAGLAIPKLAARDCALFLWQNDPLPRSAALLAEVWGFRIVTDNVFIWEKTDGIGMGYWSRKQCETVCLMVRGNPARKSKSVRQLIQAPRREHSQKPDEIYQRIQDLVGGPYLEIFARQKWPGWYAWGNEVGKYTAGDKT